MANNLNDLTELEDRWMPARLIPTSGIKGVDEQERRATSALLSVMMAVPEFSRTLLRRLGATGTIRAFIEPPFKMADGREVRPDGVIVARRGSSVWRALVEVKTATNDLRVDQIECYLELAAEIGADAVLTISNQMNTAADEHPLQVSRKLVRRVGLHHFSWVEILTEAVIQREHRGVSDPDQAWILSELIAYLKHPSSGAMQFQDMGTNWVAVRDAARDGMLHSHDPGVAEVVGKWDQFVQYLCLHLAGDLGVEVTHVVPRAEQSDSSARRQRLIRELVSTKTLEGTIKIRNAIGPVTLTASLNARTTRASVAVAAPDSGKPLTRINWLVRQLASAPESLIVEASFEGARQSNSARLGDLRLHPDQLLLADRSRPPRMFTISQSKEMGTKRGGVSGSFIGEATELTLSFYRMVVQVLRPWSSSAPKLPTKRDAADPAIQRDNIVDEVARAESEMAESSSNGSDGAISQLDPILVAVDGEGDSH